MSEINCLDAVLILSPTLFQDSLKCDKYYIDGKFYTISAEQRFKILDNESISKVLNLPYVSKIEQGKYSSKIYEEMQQRLIGFIDSSFLLDSSNGETYNIWTWVPCGHCELCNAHKMASLSQRAQFAYEESLAPAYFVTLTYNNTHLPSKPEFVKRHVQLFFKRLRKNGFMNQPDRPMKYIYTCEVGNNGRYHVHLIIFGLPIYDDEFDSHNTYLVTKFLQYCWRDAELLDDNFHYRNFDSYVKNYPLAWSQPKDYDPWSRGYVNVKLLQDPHSACNYVLKYTFKNRGTDKFIFRGQSTNLGLEFAKSLRSFALSSSDGTFKYCSKITNKVVEVKLSQYFINKLFPSFSKIVPNGFRKSWYDAVLCCRKLIEYKFSSRDVKFSAWFTLDYLYKHYSFLSVLNDFYTEPLGNSSFINSKLVSDSHLTFVRHHLTRIADDMYDLQYGYPDLDLKSLNSQLFDRESFLNKFKQKSFSEKCKVASDFRRSVLINISKSTL